MTARCMIPTFLGRHWVRVGAARIHMRERNFRPMPVSPSFREFSGSHRILSWNMRHFGNWSSDGPARRLAAAASFVLVHALSLAHAQSGSAPPGQPQAASQPVSISLEEAIHRAQVSEPGYRGRHWPTAAPPALDRSIARAGVAPRRHLSQPVSLHPAERASQNPASQGRIHRSPALHRQQRGA